jgi:hypothetical protein
VSVANATSVALAPLSAAMCAVSAKHSATSAKGLQAAINALSNQTSQAMSVGSAASAAIVALSLKVSADITSQVAALSTNVTSVRDAEISNRNSAVQVASAAATSADGHANTVSAAVVALSLAASAAINATSNALSLQIYSVRDAEISNRNSAIAALSLAASANITSQVQAHSATQDTKISSLSALVISNIASINSNIAILSTVSARNGAGTSAKGLQTAFNQVSNKISATAQKTFTWVFSAPAVGGLYGAQLPATVVAVNAIFATLSSGTTITGNIEKRPTFGAAGSNVLSADITGSATPVSQAADTSAGAATITAANWLYVDISGTSGTPAAGIVVLQVKAP